MLRFAVVGAGSIGREFALKHLTQLNGVVVTTIVDCNSELAQSLAKDVSLQRVGGVVVGNKYNEGIDTSSISADVLTSLPQVTASTDISTVWDNFDAVYVGTPPSTHSSIVLKALAANKHVLLEKPISILTADAVAIVEAAEKARNEQDLVVNVNIGMRFNCAAIEMRRWLQTPEFGPVASYQLKIHFQQWPRAWQNQPWVAQRVQGGMIYEVGTHYVFGILEILGHDSVQAVHCDVEYPDGAEGTQAETSCQGYMQLKSGGRLQVDLVSASAEAATAGKDIYELIITSKTGEQLVLYDFTRLRRQHQNRVEEICSGSYGRTECVTELVKAVQNIRKQKVGGGGSGSTAVLEEANLVTPRQAMNAQQIIAKMKNLKE